MQRPSRLDMGGAFSLVAYVILGLAIAAALGVFGYGQYLNSTRDAKAGQLVAAQQGLDQGAVEKFVRLRDRIASVPPLLDNHSTPSAFFNALEKLTLQTVRFTSFKFAMQDDHSADIEMSGVAKTFNALAAQSAAFGTEPRIKRTVFSGIAVNKDGTVNFTLTAQLDSRIVTGEYLSAPAPAGSAAAGTGTASTTP